MPIMGAGQEGPVFKRSIPLHPYVRLAVLLGLLYLFFVSISLMGASFKFFGKDFATRLLETTSSPFVGLFIGILATSLIQSSSTTTSMAVALVAAGGLDVAGAIPIVIGANIGTSVTNTLVSVGHISRPEEFKRAFSAATVHDFFNLLTVLVLFPLQLGTNFLGRSAGLMANGFQNIGGLKVSSPLKLMTKHAVEWISDLTHDSGWMILVVSVVLLFIALRYIVVNMRALIIGRVESFFNESLFRTAARAFVLGAVFTVMVQSSSITTSLAVPLAGAGILTLRQIFPMTLGANLGTTITGILASLVTGNLAAVTVAFAHLLFNVFGILIIWPVRRLPMFLAESLARWSTRAKILPFVYVLVVFYLLPLALITVLG